MVKQIKVWSTTDLNLTDFKIYFDYKKSNHHVSEIQNAFNKHYSSHQLEIQTDLYDEYYKKGEIVGLAYKSILTKGNCTEKQLIKKLNMIIKNSKLFKNYKSDYVVSI